MRTLIEDLRFGLRLLRNHPGFAVVATFTLALGIAANTTVFSWIDAILLHPLPGVADVPRLAVLELATPSGEFGTASMVEYRHFRDNLKLFSGLAASHQDTFSMGEPEDGQRIWGELVSGNYFAVLGVKPILGRTFAPQEYGDTPAANPIAVISEHLWRSRFKSDPRVLGTTIRLNRHDLTIIGVAPPEFGGIINGLVFDIWAPITMAKELGIWNEGVFRYRGSRGLNLIGRLHPGVTIGQAQAEAVSSAHQLDLISPETARGYTTLVSSVVKAHYGAADLLQQPLRILMAVAIVMLLIVCANVTNLLLARSTSRQREFGIRLALGARRWRIARQLLTETSLLAIAGAAGGLLLTPWLQTSLLWLIPRTGYPVAMVGTGLNGRVLAFTLLVCGFATLVSGVAPALYSVRTGLNETLKEGGRSGRLGARTHRTSGLLVISEVALAAVALIGAGLFVKSFQNARTMRLGFDQDEVALSQFYLSSAGYQEAQTKQFCRILRDRLAATPGVEKVSYADSVPLGASAPAYHTLVVQGYVPGPAEDMAIHRTLTSPGYFELMKIPLLQGRDFTDLDNMKSPRVMIINQSFARRFFGGAYPLGRKVRVEQVWFTVVGMAKDSKYLKPSEPPQPFFYLPFEQWFNTGLNVNMLVRTSTDVTHMAATVRRQAAAIDPNVGTFFSVPLNEYTTMSLYPLKVATSLLGTLSLVSLLLAALGLYSVISYAVSQRTQEIGIRMAMGARPFDVLRMVGGQGMLLTLGGLAAGTVASLFATPLIANMLVDVSPADPQTFAIASAFLAGVALLATYIPASRATKVDPIIALRCE